MFNGVVIFNLTANGWIVRTVRDFKDLDFGHQVVRFGNDLIVRGRFHFKPKHGFCKRPHLIVAL